MLPCQRKYYHFYIFFVFLNLWDFSGCQPYQYIKTIAGTGNTAYNSDNVGATSSNLKSPKSVFPDSVGNLYISDSGNQRIRKVSAGTNIISTIAGTGVSGTLCGDGGAATASCLNYPSDVWVSSNGVVYIADTLNHRIRMISTSGII